MTLLLDEPLPHSTPPISPELGPAVATKSPSGWGRRILIGSGAFVLLLGVAATAIAAPHFDDGVGDRTYHPTTFTDVDHSYSFGIGTLDVDYAMLTFRRAFTS